MFFIQPWLQTLSPLPYTCSLSVIHLSEDTKHAIKLKVKLTGYNDNIMQKKSSFVTKIEGDFRMEGPQREKNMLILVIMGNVGSSVFRA